MLPDFIDAEKSQINVVPMNFRKDHVPIDGEAGEFKEVHRVDLVKKGGNGESTSWNIKNLKTDTQLWPYVEPYYDAWLKGQESPTSGTPVDVLPFLTPGLVAHLQSMMIRTAEDLAEVNDASMERIGMGARGYRDKARAYVEAKIGDGRVAAVNEKLERENKQLQAQLDELKADFEVLQSEVRGNQPPLKKRGRPPKDSNNVVSDAH